MPAVLSGYNQNTHGSVSSAPSGSSSSGSTVSGIINSNTGSSGSNNGNNMILGSNTDNNHSNNFYTPIRGAMNLDTDIGPGRKFNKHKRKSTVTSFNSTVTSSHAHNTQWIGHPKIKGSSESAKMFLLTLCLAGLQLIWISILGPLI